MTLPLDPWKGQSSARSAKSQSLHVLLWKMHMCKKALQCYENGFEWPQIIAKNDDL